MASLRRTFEEVLKKSCQEKEKEFLDIDSNSKFMEVYCLGTDGLYEGSSEWGWKASKYWGN